MRWNSGRLITLGATALLMVIGVRLLYTIWSLESLDRTTRGVDRLQAAMDAVLSVHAGLSQVEGHERGYLLTRDRQFLEDLEELAGSVQADLDRLDAEVAFLPGRSLETRKVREVVAGRLQAIRSRVALLEAGRVDEALERFRTDPGEKATGHALGTVIQIEKTRRDEIVAAQAEVGRTFALAQLAECVSSGVRALLVIAGAVVLHRVFRAQIEARRVIDRQKRMLEATLMSLGDGMIATDNEGRITTLNDVASELIGTTRGASVGAPIAEVFRTYDHPGGVEIGCAVQSILRSRPEIDRKAAEAFIRHGEAAEDFRPLSLTASRIRDDLGRTTGTVLVFRDISAIRRYQSELSQSEARFRQLANALPISMFVMRRDRRLEYLNQAAIDFVGQPPPETDHLDWHLLIHPEDQERVLGILEQTMAGDESAPSEVECRFLRGDGQYRRFLVRMVPLDADTSGQTVTWLGTAIDIHDRWLAEARLAENQERLQLAIEAGQVLPWEIDFVADRFRADPIFDRLHGFPIGQAPTNMEGWIAYMHPDDAEAYISAIGRYEQGETPWFVFDYRAPQPDGSVRWFQTRGWGAERGEAGQPIRYCGTTIDITSQKLAQIEADALLSRLQAIYRASDRIAMIAVGNDGIITDFNSGAEAILGYQAEEVVGALNPLAFHDPLDCREVGEQILQPVCPTVPPERQLYEYLAARGVLEHEWTWIRKDGSRLVVDLVHTLIRDASGKVIGCLGIGRDVTDRKRVESELRQSEERFRVLAEALPHQTWVMRPDLTFEYINGPGVEYTGLSAGEFTPGGFYPLMHPEDVARVEAEVAALHHAGEPYEVEFRLRSKDGEYRWVLSRSVPVRDGSNNVIRWVGTTTDIHERWTARAELAASEKRFQDAAEALNGYIYEADFRANATTLSRGFENLLGLPPEETGTISRWIALIHPDDREHTDQKLKLFVAMRQRRAQFEYRLLHSEGHYLDVWDSAVLEYDEAGDLVRAVGHVIDVSDRKRFAEALQEADRRKDNFLATLSHELRNPLAPMRSALQAIRLTLHEPQSIQANLAIVERQLGQMVRLVDDLLDVTRISRGKLRLRKESADLGDLLRRAIETCQPHLMASGHEVRLELPDRSVPLEADAIRLEQVFANLIHNASKYSRTGGSIVIQGRFDDTRAVVSVRDDGIGIAPDQLARIFEMFSQADQAIDRSQGGLGVGLSLVRSLVELHGGTVEARSEGLGLGSEFVIRLPIGHPSDLGSATAPFSSPVATRPPGPQALDGQRPDRILVVDDNKDAANMMATVLRLYGHEVAVAYDGEASLSTAEAFHPTVVILDIGMPRLNGYDACRALRTLPSGRDALLIAVTGWGQEEDRERSRHAGFDHHLVKPVETATLLTLLAEPRPVRT